MCTVLLLPGGYPTAVDKYPISYRIISYIVQCVRKVAAHLEKVLEVMSTASVQAWTRLILFAYIFCRSACEMFLMYTVTAVFNSLSVRVRSRYTADFATYRSLSAQRLSERTVQNTLPIAILSCDTKFINCRLQLLRHRLESTVFLT
jgi:hypothetical protein